MLTRLESVIRYPVLALLLAMLAGCALFDGEDEEEQGPAPLVEFDAEVQLDKVWSDSVGNGQGKLYNRLAPAVDGDKIVVAAADGTVEAFNRLDGDSLWDVDLDVPLTAGAGIGGGRVFVASGDGRVWALSADSGEVLWKTQLSGEVLAPPQSDGELVVVQTFDGHLVGLDAASGVRRWSYASTVPVLMLRATSTPMLVDGAVIAGFANGKVVAVDANTGKLFWETRVGASQGSSEIERLTDVAGDLLVSDETLFAVAYQGQLNAIELRSGRRLWQRDASSYVGLAQDFGNIYVSSAAGSVLAFAKNDQGVRWEQTALARRQLSGPAVLGDVIAVGDIEGYLHLLSQQDGRFVGRVRVDSDGVRVAPLVVGDLLYVYGNGGKLVAYRLEAED